MLFSVLSPNIILVPRLIVINIGSNGNIGTVNGVIW